MKKTSVFIASSVESLDIAKSVQENLEYSTYATIWSQAFFELSRSAIDSLVDKLNNFDFSIFIFSPDDVSIIREKEHLVIRDNVIFELGLFIGYLGKERCFIIQPRNQSIHIPTDILAITSASYDENHPNLTASLGPACSKIEKRINELSFFHSRDRIQQLMGEGIHDSLYSLSGEIPISNGRGKLKFSPEKWTVSDLKQNPAAEYQLIHFSHNAHAIVITESLSLKLEVVISLAMKNILVSGSEVNKLYRNNVTVKNGKAAELGLEITNVNVGVRFFYHNLYIASKKGVIQIMTWCPIELKNDLMVDLQELTTGFQSTL